MVSQGVGFKGLKHKLVPEELPDGKPRFDGKLSSGVACLKPVFGPEVPT